MEKRRVAITGMGVLSPIGQSIAEVAASLRTGRSGITRIDLPKLRGGYPAGVVDGVFSDGFSAIERPFLERCHELAIVAAAQAIQDAGIASFASFGERAGLYYGNVNGGAASAQNWCEEVILNGKRKSRPFTAMTIMSNAGGAQIAIRNRILGPVLTHASACASSGVAIGEAMRAIADGYLDIAVVGGAEAPLTDALIGVFDGTRALAKLDADDVGKTCKPFSKDRTGLVLGEGAAFLVLEAEEAAKRRGAKCHGYMLGYGVACDASHIGQPASQGQIRCLEHALRSAGITAADIQYINAHATATRGGDEIEAAAIRAVFGDTRESAAVSSTKSVHGHLLGATSALECLITVVAINESIMPASGAIGVVDEKCSLNHVGESPRTESIIDRAVSFSCGFGGTNAALVIGSQDSVP
ncbi:MAG TPA: beta-ketoacyl-[acyl-carrier-protein] synthase family protein [Pseudoxanthomonas sp.]|nr:beta-ketoacyl-[acyl-carrier-protein] synthase family protein [Pseudoxanthomonas sp.]